MTTLDNVYTYALDMPKDYDRLPGGDDHDPARDARFASFLAEHGIAEKCVLRYGDETRGTRGGGAWGEIAGWWRYTTDDPEKLAKLVTEWWGCGIEDCGAVYRWTKGYEARGGEEMKRCWQCGVWGLEVDYDEHLISHDMSLVEDGLLAEEG